MHGPLVDLKNTRALWFAILLKVASLGTVVTAALSFLVFKLSGGVYLAIFVASAVTALCFSFLSLGTYTLAQEFITHCAIRKDISCEQSDFIVQAFIQLTLSCIILTPLIFWSTRMYVDSLPTPPWEENDNALNKQFIGVEQIHSS
ncbi:hypothetical protein RCL1_001999 [Eukaryota sp. TZLM3-RCL]